MKLNHRTALIGFCPDLTDPDAASIPVATLTVGEGEGHRIAAVVAIMPGLNLDDLSRAMLADVPGLLRRHVEEAVDALPPHAPIENILHSLNRALRNSLHVMNIGPETSSEVVGTGLVTSTWAPVMEGGLDILRQALESVGIQLIVLPENKTSLPTFQVPMRQFRTIPEQFLWPLGESPRYLTA